MNARPVIERDAAEAGGFLQFYCPGCRCRHYFADATSYEMLGCKPVPGKTWQWNHNYVEPTVAPSINCNADDPATRCHFFLRGGKIDYQADCHHAMKGQQQVPMEPIDEN